MLNIYKLGQPALIFVKVNVPAAADTWLRAPLEKKPPTAHAGKTDTKEAELGQLKSTEKEKRAAREQRD